MKKMIIPRKKTWNKNILFYFLMFYTIVPLNYYVIGPVNVLNTMSLLLFLWFMINDRLIIPSFRDSSYFFWIYMGLYALQALITAGVVKGLGYILSYIFVCIAVYTYVRSQDDFIKVIDNLIYLSGFLGILGVIETITHNYFFQSGLFMYEESMGLNVRYGLMRASTTFGHPINFGIYQAIMAAFTFYRITNKNIHDNKRNLFIIILIVLWFSVFASISRLAILLLLFSQLILINQLSLNRKILLFVSFPVISILAMYFFDAVGFRFSEELFDDLLGSFFKMLGLGSGSDIEYDYGNRFDLYSWVAVKMKGNELFGLGIGAEFAHQMSAWFTKTSIEVHYLYVYYMQGIVGVTGLVLSYLGVLFYIYKRRGMGLHFEVGVKFNFICLIICVGYFICLFGVQETDLKRLYNILIILCICYNRILADTDGQAE